MPISAARWTARSSSRTSKTKSAGTRCSARFTEVFKTRTRDEWFDHLTKSDICVGRMLTLDELADDPQIRARNMIVEVETPSGEKVKQVGISLKFSDTPGSIRSTAPALGQHTDEILADLGYGAAAIARSTRRRGHPIAGLLCKSVRPRVASGR